ncbi:hypothetical protein pdam_00022155 [Pocillopora damicornis]|uniref:Uncharacterized protein n=1 Tax=Pocillopora damicornis TaxID=46731 RepID=A0A3M6UYT8_POCDA|nr:hypothetical protein pdam_00022155 [Pocillopora damicornis]
MPPEPRFSKLGSAITEICLPGNVEQSLLSASCDAKEIVHQLKENLQLNKDIFERPDYNTKKIVRSLAHRAKDLKRLDVFEHLREIAPAGTTGPFLAENLPVQEMPTTKNIVIRNNDITRIKQTNK